MSNLATWRIATGKPKAEPHGPRDSGRSQLIIQQLQRKVMLQPASPQPPHIQTIAREVHAACWNRENHIPIGDHFERKTAGPSFSSFLMLKSPFFLYVGAASHDAWKDEGIRLEHSAPGLSPPTLFPEEVPYLAFHLRIHWFIWQFQLASFPYVKAKLSPSHGELKWNWESDIHFSILNVKFNVQMQVFGTCWLLLIFMGFKCLFFFLI